MIFDYLRTVSALDTIDIDDIGNCCINALNDDAEEWFLIIDTYEGWTRITEFGPLVVDEDKIKSFFNYNTYESDFKEKKIKTTIDKFINNPKHMITQVYTLEKDFAQERLNAVKHLL